MKAAATPIALVIGLSLLAMVVIWGLRQPAHVSLKLPKVTVGARDSVYYSHSATAQDAASLGAALQTIGFFTDKGGSAFLSKGRNGTVVSFVVQQGGWDLRDRVAADEEIGRRIAPRIGGYPIKIRLVDAAQSVHREITIGKAVIGDKDEVYYLGSATNADAVALGQALKTAGYFTGEGASVELTKDGGSAISFVVSDGAWEHPQVVAAFERLIRRAAPSAGGLPIALRLLNPNMEPEREVMVR
jgi:hypothetical protein